jgi:hypothetical protein
LKVGGVEGRRGLRIDGRKVSVTDGVWAGLLPECHVGGVDVGVTVDAATEGGAPRETDGVCAGHRCHVTHVPALPTEHVDELAQAGSRRREVVVS